MPLNQIISQNILFLFLILILWLAILSYIIFKMISHYNRLTRDVEGESLQKVLERLLNKSDLSEKEIDKLQNQLKDLKVEGEKHLQKIGVLRFNPYDDTGGDQSFVISLLDKNDNGFVITSMHGREKTRIYAKPVTEGKAKNYPFSDEEKKAIETARKVKD